MGFLQPGRCTHLDVRPAQDATLPTPPRAGQPRHGRVAAGSEPLAAVAIKLSVARLLPARRLLARWVRVTVVPRGLPRLTRAIHRGNGSLPVARAAGLALRPAARHPGYPAGVPVLDADQAKVDTCKELTRSDAVAW